MSLLDRLLGKLGLRRIERRRFTLDGVLVRYVQALAEHEQRPPGEIASDLLATGAAQRDLAEETYQRWMTLSQREQQVAALVCLNYTNRQIGARLSITTETAKSHVKKILYKFDLHSKEELRMLLSDWDFSAWR